MLTEELTFPGMKGLANLMRRRLQGVAMDREGLRPDAFERACRTGGRRRSWRWRRSGAWSDPRGYHLWLELPEPWSSRDFVDQARRRGVAVCGPEVFVAGRGRIPHAVRVALQAPRERRRLEEGAADSRRAAARAP